MVVHYNRHHGRNPKTPCWYVFKAATKSPPYSAWAFMLAIGMSQTKAQHNIGFLKRTIVLGGNKSSTIYWQGTSNSLYWCRLLYTRFSWKYTSKYKAEAGWRGSYYDTPGEYKSCTTKQWKSKRMAAWPSSAVQRTGKSTKAPPVFCFICLSSYLLLIDRFTACKLVLQQVRRPGPWFVVQIRPPYFCGTSRKTAHIYIRCCELGSEYDEEVKLSCSYPNDMVSRRRYIGKRKLLKRKRIFNSSMSMGLRLWWESEA